MADQESLLIAPDPKKDELARLVLGRDHMGEDVETRVIEERPLTIFLNGHEILTAMTIGDYPDYLARGFLSNQGMLGQKDEVTSVEHDAELGVVVVRTKKPTGHEQKQQKKIRTSGCAMGTIFSDVIELFRGKRLPDTQVRSSELFHLTREITQIPSLYLAVGAIHGTVLCDGGRPLVYMEDVGRHNAVDKVAGWMHHNQVSGANKLLYTTGRLTSEMVIKTVMMGIPVLASRSGFTAWAVSLAREVNLTLIGRLRGERFICLAGQTRLIYDEKPGAKRKKGKI